MASLVMGVAGGVVGFMVGGPAGAAMGFSLGSAAGGVLFPPKGPDGPRIGDLAVQASTYGKSIPIPNGCDRVAGNIIWADTIKEHPHEEGGKGGPEYTTYSYTCSFASSIVAGPIMGILRIWADGLLIYDRRPTNTGAQVGFKASSHKIYLGTETQMPDPTIQAIIGDTPAYRGQAYIVFADLELGKFGNRIPSLTFEYVTSGSEDIPPSATFGEAYGLTNDSGQTDDTFSATVDSRTGHLWLSTTTGHARRDPVTGEYSIDPAYGPVPQIQEYDPVTNEILYVIEPPPVVETTSTGPVSVYPMQGQMVYSGGYVFIGRGLPGLPSELGTPSPFAHGAVINTETHSLSYLYSECSQEQFQNAFYWPTVPVPVIDSNKVFMASGNGAIFGLAVGFSPAASGGGMQPTLYPVPDRTQEVPRWSAPAGWRQARAEGACPADRSPDYVSINFPDWSLKSTVLEKAGATVVQGYGSNTGPWLTWVANSPAVTANALDLMAPSQFSTVYLPGSGATLPIIAWDNQAQILWAFAALESNGTILRGLYAIQVQGGGLSLSDAGFAFPATEKEVRAMTVDPTTGNLRIVRGGGPNQEPELILFNPTSQQIIETLPIDVDVNFSKGELWDYPEQGKLIFSDGLKLVDIRYGAPLNAYPVNLGAIVADISRRAGLSPDDIDVTELTDMVDGYTITHQMAARSALEPLMQTYFFDPVESDWKIAFRKRGRSVSFTITDEELAAHSSGSEPPDLIEVMRKQELDLPQSVSVKYINPGADYQPGTQYEARQTGRSNSPVTVELPIVMSDEKAKAVAAAALYTAWAERTGLKFTTSMAYAKVEPTDVGIVHGRRVRVANRKRNGGLIEWECFADGNTIYPSDTITQGGAAAPAGPVDQVITTTPLTALQIIGTPLLQDTDAAPGFYLAAAGMGPGWTGAQVWKSTDAGVSYAPLSSVTTASLIGTAAGALGAYHGGSTFDEINTVKVSLLANGATATPASATESSVLNGANAVLIGNEVIQYKRAVLNDDGSYTLSGLLRYRRGTDGATHAAGERVVFLSANLVRVTVPTSEIGLARMYKAISNGGTLAEAPAISFTYEGNDLKPYAPVHIGGWRAVNGDLTLTWVRRARIGGEWRDGVEVPLAEAVEAYDIEIMDGATIKRTFSGVTSPTVVYTEGQQVSDFGSAQASVQVRVYQLSSVIGRGFPGAGSV